MFWARSCAVSDQLLSLAAPGHVGKLPPARLQNLLKNRLGQRSKDVIVGPGAGLDCAVLQIAPGRYMAIAEDPIFPAPGLPLSLMGQFTVHIGASDVAVAGVKPSHMTYTLLLPPHCPEADAETIIESISATAAELDIAIVGGHTGWYGAVALPIVGGVTVWGYADEGQWISPGGARPGDVLLMSKGPAIEAAALLAVVWEERLKNELDAAVLRRLLNRTVEITVVDDALTAFAQGGVHAMHDATEGGILGGAWEMSDAAGLPLRLDLDAVVVPDDILAIGEALDFNIWRAISEGSLLAAVTPEAVDGVLKAWERKGIPGFVLGRFEAGLSASVVRVGGQDHPLAEPLEDPFWKLFFAAL